jgi:Raf kinase inhibitor-like YbhB/YbcL family protein
VIYNMPPDVRVLPAGVEPDAVGVPGTNDWGKASYGGPAPPIGRHRYFHRLYALDTVLPDLGEPSKSELEAAMRGHVVATAQLVGTYEAAHR